MSAGATAAVAAMIQAIKASGTIVRVEAKEFVKILAKSKAPLVVQREGGVFGTTYYYLTSYKGLAFHTKSKAPLNLPGDVELVQAESFWMPG